MSTAAGTTRPATAHQLGWTDDGAAVEISLDGVPVLTYTYAARGSPGGIAPAVLPPGPHHAGGDLVSAYRPHDHVWHKGIAWSLPHLGPDNFWGGPSYRRGQDYQWLPNNGAMRHRETDQGSGRRRLVQFRAPAAVDDPAGRARGRGGEILPGGAGDGRQLRPSSSTPS